MERRRHTCISTTNAVSTGMMKLTISGKAYLSSVSLTYFEFLGFVMGNSPFERRAVDDLFTSQILSAVKLADLLFSTKMEKSFEMPERSSILARMGILGGIMIS
jgi:hypothetical protein